MPRISMDMALLVKKNQRVGIEGLVGFTLAADVDKGCAVLALQLFEK